MSLSRRDALARLNDPRPITYDELDDVFHAFGFASDLKASGVIWYYHEKYRCGSFPADPEYDFSVLSDDQRGILAAMIRALLDNEDRGV